MVLATGGYPIKPYDIGHTIVGLADAEAMDGVTVYRYAVDEAGRAAGGRVVSA